MEQVKHTQKVKQLIKTIKIELNTGYIPIFDKYSISAKELSLLYKEDPDKIYHALSDMKSSDSIAEFEKNLIKHIELGKKEWEKWNIFIPYDLDELKRSFKFGEIEFKLTSKNRFLRELKKRKISSRFNKVLESYSGRFLKVQVYAKNYLHASEIIENDFYLIRGIIEFSDNVYMSKSSTDLENLVSLSHPKYIFYISVAISE